MGHPLTRWHRLGRYPFMFFKLLLIAVVVASVFGGLYRLRSVTMPALFAFLLAYALNPVLDYLEERKVPRTLGILFLLTIAVATGAMFLGVFLPTMAEELAKLIGRLPEVLRLVKEQWVPWLETHLKLEVPRTLPAILERLQSEAGNLAKVLLTPASDIVSLLFTSALDFLLGLVRLILIPLFAFYFLRDFDRLVAWVSLQIPSRHLPSVRRWATSIDRILAGFFRGQLTVGIILGGFYAVGLTIVGVRLGGMIGLLTGLLNVIPYLGTITGISLSLFMALLQFSGPLTFLGIILVFVVVLTLDALFITPRIVGNHTGLNPLAVIVSLLIGGDLFGIFGVLIAVPVAATMKVAASEALQAYRNSFFFTGKYAATTGLGGRNLDELGIAPSSPSSPLGSSLETREENRESRESRDDSPGEQTELADQIG